jgi:NAD(P)-dependent dehydrogenase (short-subunit alcohol dehydrogenase family)
MNIIVAGGSRGIGYALVKTLIREDAHRVMVISRNAPKLDELAAECSRINPSAEVIPLGFDLETGDVEGKLLQRVTGEFDKIHRFVYNAGFLVNKPFARLTDKDFNRMFMVNVQGAFSLIRAFEPLFAEGSHILTISSMGGYQGSMKFPGLSLYSASKGALAVLTECLAEEFRERKVKCNCLALGAVQTEMLAEAFPGYEAPLSPEQMAEFMADFCLNGHRYFNGKILPVSLSIP